MAIRSIHTIGNSPRQFGVIFVLAVTISCLLSAGAFSDEMPILSSEFWVETAPLIEIEGESTESPEDQIRILLEEARYVFSGMIYGFSFRYVPLDLRREVEEEFELEPLYEIVWGDPRLTVAESRRESGRRYALIRYWISEEQSSWVRFWDSNVHATAAAFGAGDFFDGRVAKFAAMEAAIRESVRAYLRPRELNKPKEISGRLVFAEAPYVIIDGGEYRAKVEVKLDVREVVQYQIF